MHPCFNQENFQIMTHLQESVVFSQTGQLLRGTAEAFWLEIGVPFTMGTVNFKIGSDVCVITTTGSDLHLVLSATHMLNFGTRL